MANLQAFVKNNRLDKKDFRQHLRNLTKKEGRLPRKNIYDIMDLTPYNAITRLIYGEQAGILYK